MKDPVGEALLRRLERSHVVPRGERLVDHEAAAARGVAAPVPVLLLTEAAIYALRSGTEQWVRIPVERIRRLLVSTDATGILTRYQLVDDAGEARLDLAVAFARPTFRAQLMKVVPMAVVHAPSATEVRRDRRPRTDPAARHAAA